MRLPQTGVRQRAAPTTDRYGNPGRDWTDPDELIVKRLRLYHARSIEQTDRGDRVVTRLRVMWSPADLDVQPADRLVVDGVTYEIDGDVYRPVGRRGQALHAQAHLKTVSEL